MSLLFDVMNAITGTRDAPATHNMPANCRLVLLVLANHGELAWPSADTIALATDLGVSTVRACLADLEEHKWIRDTEQTRGKGGRETKVYEVHAFGMAWDEERKAKRRRAPPDSSQGATSCSPPPPDSQGASTEQPGYQDAEARVSGGGDKPLREPLQEPLKEPPICAPARVRAEALPLFSSLGPSTSTPVPGSAVRGKPPRAPKPPREKTAAEGYADAFVQAFTDRGRTVTRPTGPEQKELGRICQAHALERNRVALVGAALPVWIRAQVGAMLDDLEDPERHKGGVSVHGLKLWLNNRGGPVRVRELEPAPASRPSPSLADDSPIREPPPMPDAAVLRAARSLPRSEGTDAVIAKYEALVAAAVPA